MKPELLKRIVEQIDKDAQKDREHFEDLTNQAVFNQHAELVIKIANVLLAPQRRKFVIDDRNRYVLYFLLYYFNDCPLAEQVFKGKGYKLHKNLLIQGAVGTGKTLIMQIFAEYLRYTMNPKQFYNLSVTQMVNYYTIHNNLDRYTYNEESSVGFKCNPENICLNDIGIGSKSHFGMDTKLLTNEFLHARNEVWVHYKKSAHLTTNLTTQQLTEEFKDNFGRLVDRFKTYNVIELNGESRR